ncbi:hypothetical protein PF004_g5676 [Phytophthora fragariae]|uniref:Protein kinase domain-containing protein n=1 Tax=Phytophthora fragariae TaxID=53985 RepID=A0A6G0PF51_9STRA|nr:hypothetical protein PF004_g5676 [Phytophthora fragariae]
MATPDATAPPVVKNSHKFAAPLDGSQFEMGVTLGTGSFGRVRFATHKATNSYWAIKILKKAEIIRLQQVEHMLSEKSILLCLDHPFIVNLAGTYQDTKYLYMVLDLHCLVLLGLAARFTTSTDHFHFQLLSC